MYIPPNSCTVGINIGGTAIIGDGGTTNYAAFAADGELTLFGTARITNGTWIGASGIKAPGTKPATWIEHGISGVWRFADGDDETVVASIRIPNRMARAEDPTIMIGWSADGISPGNCEWQVEYLWSSVDEDTTAVADDTLTVTTAASTTSNGMRTSTVTLANPSATDICVHLRIKRLAAGGNDTIADTVELHGICMSFISDKLGEAT